jgi:hypothetical protein
MGLPSPSVGLQPASLSGFAGKSLNNVCCYLFCIRTTSRMFAFKSSGNPSVLSALNLGNTVAKDGDRVSLQRARVLYPNVLITAASALNRSSAACIHVVGAEPGCGCRPK